MTSGLVVWPAVSLTFTSYGVNVTFANLKNQNGIGGQVKFSVLPLLRRLKEIKDSQ